MVDLTNASSTFPRLVDHVFNKLKTSLQLVIRVVVMTIHVVVKLMVYDPLQLAKFGICLVKFTKNDGTFLQYTA